MLIKGENLTEAQRAQVLAAFVHRLTVENPYARTLQKQTKVELSTDAEWIKAHAFYFTKDGKRLMANRRYCEPVYMAD